MGSPKVVTSSYCGFSSKGSSLEAERSGAGWGAARSCVDILTFGIQLWNHYTAAKWASCTGLMYYGKRNLDITIEAKLALKITPHGGIPRAV
jgi:hypothetical protein